MYIFRLRSWHFPWFLNVSTPKPQNAKKTDQAEQIGKIDRLTGNRTD